MFSIHLYLLLLTWTKIYAFDAGFIEMANSRETDKDTTHYGITICGLCRVTIDYLKIAYKIDLTHLNTKFNEVKGQCDENLVKDIINNLKSSAGNKLNVWEYSRTLKTIASANTKTDLKEMFNEESHFDSETFVEGSNLILRRYKTSLDSILKEDNYDQARQSFGSMLHTLQDFYSHTNFIELDYKSPTNVLGERVFQKREYAASNKKTCVSCTGSQCQINSNLDENIRKNKILTSGYFIPIGFNLFKKKPEGKCSHGGSLDSSQNTEPTGGINKDKLDSVHGHLHYKAANMAYQATVKILKQLQKDIGDQAFASFLALQKNLNSLVISIDTTCTIGNYVDLAKQISINIINQYGTLEYAPHNYILVTFNSDKAQLVLNTRNPNDLIKSIEKLKACEKPNSSNGQMYYNSLVEALKYCQSSSVIFTFTDSPARDAIIKYRARALLRSKRVVLYSFMGQETRRRSFENRVDFIDPLDGTGNDIDLASMSGGLTYPITTEDRSIVSEFILRRLEATRMQTLFIAKANAVTTSFHVDSSMDELHLDISSMIPLSNIEQIELRMPNNTIYSLTKDRINSTNLYMWKIMRPSIGEWRLKTIDLLPTFDHSIQIQGKTSVVCSSILQKEMEANTDTSGYTQLTTEPIVNSELMVLTTCENVNITRANIYLINQAGQVITNYSSRPVNQIEVLTKIRIPRQGFRIETVLTLNNGRKIQRIEKQLISPTMFSIELTNQPYIIKVGETIQMNYTIKSFQAQRINLRLQISDTLKLLAQNSLDKNITFTNSISQMTTLTLPKNFREKWSSDLVIFGLSTYDDKTKKFSYENDEIVSVYLDSSSTSKQNLLLFFLCLFVKLLK